MTDMYEEVVNYLIVRGYVTYQQVVEALEVAQSAEASGFIDKRIGTEEWAVATGLAELLNRRVQENGYKGFVLNKTSIGTIERMIRLDGVSPQRVREMIEWSTQDEFWATNIRSTTNLRKHFETMLVQAKKRPLKKPVITTPPDNSWDMELERRHAESVPKPKHINLKGALRSA